MKDYLAAMFGQKQEPTDEVKALKERLEAVRGLLDNERTINAQLNQAYGLLGKDHIAKLEDSQQTVACLVSMMGNNVIIGIDLIKAMRQADVYLNYKGTDDGVLVSLLTEEEIQALSKKESK